MILEPASQPVDDPEGSVTGYKRLALAILLRRLDDLADPKRHAQALRWLLDLLADEESVWTMWLFQQSGVPRTRVTALMLERTRVRKHVQQQRHRRRRTTTLPEHAHKISQSTSFE